MRMRKKTIKMMWDANDWILRFKMSIQNKIYVTFVDFLLVKYYKQKFLINRIIKMNKGLLFFVC